MRPTTQYRRFLSAEREETSRGLAQGAPISAIAGRLGRAPSTRTREVNRNSGTSGYWAFSAGKRLSSTLRPIEAARVVSGNTSLLRRLRNAERLERRVISGRGAALRECAQVAGVVVSGWRTDDQSLHWRHRQGGVDGTGQSRTSACRWSGKAVKWRKSYAVKRWS